MVLQLELIRRMEPCDSLLCNEGLIKKILLRIGRRVKDGIFSKELFCNAMWARNEFRRSILIARISSGVDSVTLIWYFPQHFDT